MRRPISNSGGRPTSTLREVNACHSPAGSPKGGQFCSGRQETLVGITSARPGKTPLEVYGQMRDFAAALQQLPDVTGVQVQPGIGQWDGGWEPSWVVRYTGNGEARRLMAATGKRFDQDAVLLMKPCRGPDCDSLADITFAKPLNRIAMTELSSVFSAAGLGGWTWAKVGGKTVLRTAAVPDWGTDRATHLRAVKIIRGVLAVRGHVSRVALRSVKTEAIGRDLYDAVIGERP